MTTLDTAAAQRARCAAARQLLEAPILGTALLDSVRAYVLVSCTRCGAAEPPAFGYVEHTVGGGKTSRIDLALCPRCYDLACPDGFVCSEGSAEVLASIIERREGAAS